MRYVVDARFSEGRPRLRVRDAESGEVRVEWFLEKSRTPFQENRATVPELSPETHQNLQSLLKNLFLIACSDDLDRLRDDKHAESGLSAAPSREKSIVK